MKNVFTFMMVLFITSFIWCQEEEGKTNPIKDYYTVKKNDLSRSSKLSIGDKVLVYTHFIIDNNNEIKILRVKGPDLFLEKKATQIINELPKVNPDFITSQEKNYKYTMPIKFEIVK